MPLARSITLRSSSAVWVRSSSSLQAGEGVEARDAEIENTPDALLLETVDDIGGDAGVDGGLDRGGIALVDEHGDWPPHRAADLEHLRQHVAARIFQIDQNDVGVEAVDAREKLRRLFDQRDMGVAGLAQPVGEDGGAHRTFVDYDDFEHGIHGDLMHAKGIPLLMSER